MCRYPASFLESIVRHLLELCGGSEAVAGYLHQWINLRMRYCIGVEKLRIEPGSLCLSDDKSVVATKIDQLYYSTIYPPDAVDEYGAVR